MHVGSAGWRILCLFSAIIFSPQYLTFRFLDVALSIKQVFVLSTKTTCRSVQSVDRFHIRPSLCVRMVLRQHRSCDSRMTCSLKVPLSEIANAHRCAISPRKELSHIVFHFYCSYQPVNNNRMTITLKSRVYRSRDKQILTCITLRYASF